MLVVACADVAGRADAIRAALAAGIDTVQLREPGGAGRAVYEAALALRAWTRATGAALIVNDRIDVALAVAADGVHLPAASWPIDVARRLLEEGARGHSAEGRGHEAAGRVHWIGRSTHAPAEVVEAARSGADYVVLGPIYDTPAKRAYGAPLGVEALARSRTRTPMVAIGGVTTARVPELLNAGATGVAVIREILEAADPGAAAGALVTALAARGRR